MIFSENRKPLFRIMHEEECRMHWNVGRVKITKIVELETVGSTRFILPLATPEEIQKLPWLIPDFATEEGRLKMSIHSLVVETPARRIVVDTGLGNDKEGRKVPTWNNRKEPFLETMTAAGFPPDSIDTVLCTHLHVDHVGWNTRLVGGKWLPTFANARYVFGRTEYEHWRDHSDEPEKSAIFNDSVKPIVDAGKAELVASDARLCDEITLISTPGHSPGHMSLHIKSDGEEGLLTGDIAHHPLPDGASRLVIDRRFRSGPVGGDAARCVRAFCRHAHAGNRRPFQRRPHPA
jgi:glyoxylase-like metal-dependent hydrolase (beta-lactamase superfamily II)